MLEMTPQEYPGYGSTDLRTPAVELQFSDGTSATILDMNHIIYMQVRIN